MNRIILRGCNYYYDERNSSKSEVVLLVHGHPFDHTMWKYQYNALEHFRLILPDLRGYGKTDYNFDKIHIEEHALDLVFLLDALKIQKVHLIGLSMGAQIIVEFARLFPQRVHSLVFCASDPSGETESSYHARLHLADRLIAIGMERYTEQDIYKYVHPQTLQAHGDAFKHLHQMMVNTKTEGAAASHRGRAERRDNFPFLKHIVVPALVLVGDCDFFSPVDEVQLVSEQIPNAEFVIIPQAGHMVNMEQPEIFNRLLINFYSQLQIRQAKSIIIN